jgi:hypothetical protein
MAKSKPAKPKTARKSRLTKPIHVAQKKKSSKRSDKVQSQFQGITTESKRFFVIISTTPENGLITFRSLTRISAAGCDLP